MYRHGNSLDYRDWSLCQPFHGGDVLEPFLVSQAANDRARRFDLRRHSHSDRGNSLMPAGKLRFRVAFDKRDAASDDGYGSKPGGWTEQFQRSCGIQYLRGGEQVIEQRMAGVVPAVLTVRVDTKTRLIDNSWRVRELASGATFNVRGIPPSDGKPLYLDLLCDTGTADG